MNDALFLSSVKMHFGRCTVLYIIFSCLKCTFNFLDAALVIYYTQTNNNLSCFVVSDIDGVMFCYL